MKLAEKTGTVERGGDLKESVFKIENNGVAFDILSNIIYTDIPRAIVRELSTNAFDAHVEAGHGDKPFNVHLPTYLEPWFEIRDFGTGLSQEDVEKTYTTFFASTRRSSNEFTGCLGLGSKSPFAYSQSFTVTSFYNGRAYLYNLFKNEQGLPSITKMAEDDTTEPNGLAIKISVRSGDHRTFIQAASKVYRHFKVKPNITGEKIDMAGSKPQIEGKNYGVFCNQNDRNGIHVVMGQVCYEVTQIDIQYHGFRGYDTLVVLNANVGDCAITANREQLKMDDRTKNFISARLKTIIDEISAKMKAEMAAAKTTLEQVYIQNRYAARFNGVSRIVSLEGFKKDKYDIRCMEVRTTYRTNKTRLTIEGQGRDMSNYTVERGFVVLEDDSGLEELTPKLRQRIIHWINSGNQNSNNTDSLHIAKITDRAEYEKHFGPITHKLSTLPDPPKVKADGTVSVMERNKSCIRKFTLSKCDWENVDAFEEGEGVAIVHRENNNVVYREVQHNKKMLERMMIAAGVKVVYGIPTRLMKKYDGDLEEVFALAKTKVEGRIKKLDDYGIAALKQSREGNVGRDLAKKISGINQVTKDFSGFLEAKAALGDASTVVSLADFFEIKILDKPNYCGIFYAKYPLLSRLDRLWSEDMAEVSKEIEIYIKAKGV